MPKRTWLMLMVASGRPITQIHPCDRSMVLNYLAFSDPFKMDHFEEGERRKIMFESLIKQHKRNKKKLMDNKGLDEGALREHEAIRLELMRFFEENHDYVRPRKNSFGVFSVEDFVKARTQMEKKQRRGDFVPFGFPPAGVHMGAFEPGPAVGQDLRSPHLYQRNRSEGSFPGIPALSHGWDNAMQLPLFGPCPMTHRVLGSPDQFLMQGSVCEHRNKAVSRRASVYDIRSTELSAGCSLGPVSKQESTDHFSVELGKGTLKGFLEPESCSSSKNRKSDEEQKAEAGDGEVLGNDPTMNFDMNLGFRNDDRLFISAGHEGKRSEAAEHSAGMRKKESEFRPLGFPASTARQGSYAPNIHQVLGDFDFPACRPRALGEMSGRSGKELSRNGHKGGPGAVFKTPSVYPTGPMMGAVPMDPFFKTPKFYTNPGRFPHDGPRHMRSHFSPPVARYEFSKEDGRRTDPMNFYGDQKEKYPPLRDRRSRGFMEPSKTPLMDYYGPMHVVGSIHQPCNLFRPEAGRGPPIPPLHPQMQYGLGQKRPRVFTSNFSRQEKRFVSPMSRPMPPGPQHVYGHMGLDMDERRLPSHEEQYSEPRDKRLFEQNFVQQERNEGAGLVERPKKKRGRKPKSSASQDDLFSPRRDEAMDGGMGRSPVGPVPGVHEYRLFQPPHFSRFIMNPGQAGRDPRDVLQDRMRRNVPHHDILAQGQMRTSIFNAEGYSENPGADPRMDVLPMHQGPVSLKAVQEEGQDSDSCELMPLGPVKTLEDVIEIVGEHEPIGERARAFIYELCDGFIEHIIHVSCALAHHRKKSTVELCDIRLSLKTEVGLEFIDSPFQMPVRQESDEHAKKIKQIQRDNSK
jgi:histone H3/H4